jgi:hypothetical protein
MVVVPMGLGLVGFGVGYVFGWYCCLELDSGSSDAIEIGCGCWFGRKIVRARILKVLMER